MPQPHLTIRCDIIKSCDTKLSNRGKKSKMEKTAIYDIWNPTSKSDIGLIINITIAVNASVLTDILSRCPSENNA